MSRFYFFIIMFCFIQKGFSQADFSYKGFLCQKNKIQFINKSIVEVSDIKWNFGDGSVESTELNPVHSYVDTGIFTVQLIITIKLNGVKDTAEQHIYISQNPVAKFNIDSTDVYYSSYSRIFTDTSYMYNPVSKYIWNFGDNTPIFETDTSKVMYKYTKSGTYKVLFKVVDIRGCTDSVINDITIHSRFFVPNVFTPNGDTNNDLFIVTSNGETLFSIEIYSRWGNLVFKRSNYKQIVWDGYMPQGKLVTPGTYYYVINSEEDNPIEEKGFLTIFY